jgi:hypothetical protein
MAPPAQSHKRGHPDSTPSTPNYKKARAEDAHDKRDKDAHDKRDEDDKRESEDGDVTDSDENNYSYSDRCHCEDAHFEHESEDGDVTDEASTGTGAPKGTYLPCLTDSIPRVDESPDCDSEPDKIFNLMWRVEKVREKRDWLKDTIRFYTDGLQSAEAVLQSTKAKLLTAEAKLDALRDVLRKSEDDGVTDLDSNDYLDSDREDAHDEAPIGVCQSVRVDESPYRDWEPNNYLEYLLLLEEGREERDQLKDTLRLIEDALHSKEAEVRSTEAKLLTTEAKLDVVRDIIW